MLYIPNDNCIALLYAWNILCVCVCVCERSEKTYFPQRGLLIIVLLKLKYVSQFIFSKQNKNIFN